MSEKSFAVSAILTTYNRPHLLEIAIHCFKQQTYRLKELIIVDDGTFPAPLMNSSRHKSIKYLKLQNKTPLGEKLNIGIRQSSGDFLFKVDDDDYYGKNYLKRMMENISHENTKTRKIYFCQP
jgi:glycosyltransferase involved in cell wall biosynthesis